MNVTVVEVVRGKDGKRYPAGLPMPRAELNRRRHLVHALVCRDGNSIRQAQRTMLASYGIRRSLGALHKDLAGYECPACADDPAQEPDRGPDEVTTTEQAITLAEWASSAAAVHQVQAGYLTSMVRDDG